MKDLKYYLDNQVRYQNAVPKLRRMISDLENGGALTPYGDRKKTALIHELGRVQGIVQILESMTHVTEPELKTEYANALLDMIRSPNTEYFVIKWNQINILDKIMKRKGLRITIGIGSEKIEQ